MIQLLSQSLFISEVSEQPQTMQNLLDTQEEAVQKVAAAIHKRAPAFILLAARGSSDNAARYGQYLFGAHNHLPVALATPSLFSLYKQPPNLKDALVISISQSGQSPDILAVMESARKQGALTVSITNTIASPLANISEHCIDIRAGLERSVAASKTYTNSLLALAMLSTQLDREAGRRKELEHLPALTSGILADTETILSVAKDYRDSHACVVIGRGFNYSTAFEIALKLKELTYLLAEPYSSADFKHGPVALVENGFLVIAVIPEGEVFEELTEFLALLKQRFPKLVVISPCAKALDLADSPIRVPAGIPEWLSPIINVIPGQIFALGLALARGIDPDHPRGLNKVTLTH